MIIIQLIWRSPYFFLNIPKILKKIKSLVQSLKNRIEDLKKDPPENNEEINKEKDEKEEEILKNAEDFQEKKNENNEIGQDDKNETLTQRTNKSKSNFLPKFQSSLFHLFRVYTINSQ